MDELKSSGLKFPDAGADGAQGLESCMFPTCDHSCIYEGCDAGGTCNGIFCSTGGCQTAGNCAYLVCAVITNHC